MNALPCNQVLADKLHSLRRTLDSTTRSGAIHESLSLFFFVAFFFCLRHLYLSRVPLFLQERTKKSLPSLMAKPQNSTEKLSSINGVCRDLMSFPVRETRGVTIGVFSIPQEHSLTKKGKKLLSLNRIIASWHSLALALIYVPHDSSSVTAVKISLTSSLKRRHILQKLATKIHSMFCVIAPKEDYLLILVLLVSINIC